MHQQEELAVEPATRLTVRQSNTAQRRRKEGLWVESPFDEVDALGGLEFKLLPKTDPRVKAAFDEGVAVECEAETKARQKKAVNGTGQHKTCRTYEQLPSERQCVVMRWELSAAILNIRGQLAGWPSSEDPDNPELDSDLVFPGTKETASESKAQWGEVMRSPHFPARSLQALAQEVFLQSKDTPKRDLEIAQAGEDSAFGSLHKLVSNLTAEVERLRGLQLS
jgi:hypothetical protein